jgi:hypothetical protein
MPENPGVTSAGDPQGHQPGPPDGHRSTDRPTATRWGYSPWLPALAAVAAAGGLVWALLSYAGRDQIVAVALTIFGLVALIVTLRFRTRLTADDAGLEVRSLIGTRRVRWDQVATIAAAPHRRLGTTSRLLEIELADESLLVFGGVELGADCESVAAELKARRSAARP